MNSNMFYPKNSLIAKLIIAVGLTLLITLSIWAYSNISNQKEGMMNDILEGTSRLSNTILLGTHYAMMLNSRHEINQIIQNIGKQKEIENIRIYNKEGRIKFSNATPEMEQETNIKAEACDVCHRSDPPLVDLQLSEKTRIFYSSQGHRMLGIISPIRNAPGCSADECHIHPADKKILGALDVVVSLEETDKEIQAEERGLIGLTAIIFIMTSAIIFICVIWFVNRPISKLIESTRQIARGEYKGVVAIDRSDEMGQLAKAIHHMGQEIFQHDVDLNRQRDEYQDLFEQVPCLITVQDRSFRMLRYNREFAEKFNPQPGDFCFHAYKGRETKCTICPVQKTFNDGKSHYSEESGVNKDGSRSHWMVRTSPIRDAKGDIVAAMEINLDITERKNLEVELEKSEKKYHAIFSNIPNPVFVLDIETLQILDCNESVASVYGYQVNELINKPFITFFPEETREKYTYLMRKSPVINQAKHFKKTGDYLFVNIRISPSEYSGRQVFLVTTSDITKRLEAEQQLIQAGKMATLGEMATGIAHELNQPLSVIKTASSFFMGKIKREEPVAQDILFNMLGKIDNNVDRASKIINHMRQFARKSNMDLGVVQANDIIAGAFEIFSQQLKLRGIEVIWEIEENLPRIFADPGRLEQVFINLLINARDAIEERWKGESTQQQEKKIFLKTMSVEDTVVLEVRDTGIGIPDDIKDRIFEPFYTTKDVGKGTGLGLSISYGIVKECGGDIRVESKPGEGTTFVLEFPVRRDNGENST